MDLFQFQAAIKGLPEATLRQFNSVLVSQLNAATRTKVQAAAAQFSRGDLASFVDKNGVRRTMRIERFNTKTVSGKDTTTGMSWRVSPGFLSLVGQHPTAPTAPIYGSNAGTF